LRAAPGEATNDGRGGYQRGKRRKKMVDKRSEDQTSSLEKHSDWFKEDRIPPVLYPDWLIDKVHAVMVEKHIRGLEEEYANPDCGISDAEVFTEFPFRYYGKQGNIDVVSLYTLPETNEVWPGQHVDMYEVQSKILNLEELLREFNDRHEFFPKYLKKEGVLQRIDYVKSYLVLLNTEENMAVVATHLETFQSVFGRRHARPTTRPENEDKELCVFDPITHHHGGVVCIDFFPHKDQWDHYSEADKNQLRIYFREKARYRDCRDFWKKMEKKVKREVQGMLEKGGLLRVPQETSR
jgi:hypothetical protein